MGMTSGNVTQRFCYDANGSVISVAYNGTYYYYLRNAQGDIVKLIDKNGQTVVEYTYDTWGKVISVTGSLASTLGKDNPFRYRGYVYDNETGWYYLQSRYYDPNTCRFVSADVMLSTGQGVLGYNAFLYCLNNPVNMEDSEGNFGLFTLIGAAVGAVTGAISGAVVGAISAVVSGEDVGTAILAGAASGAVSGALTGAAVGFIADVPLTGGASLAIAVGVGVGAGLASEYVSSLIDKKPRSTGDYIVAGAIGGISGLASFGMMNGVKGAKETGAFYKEVISSAKNGMRKRTLTKIGKNFAEDIAGGVMMGVAEWISGTKIQQTHNYIWRTIHAK